MKKAILGTAVAAALGLASVAASAAPISSLTVTFGDFNMNTPVVTDGVNEWSGTLPMGTSGLLIDNAFNFNNLFGFVDILALNSGLSGDDATGLDLSNFAVDYNGTVIGQAPDAGTLVENFDPVAGTFSADWQALIVGGPFNGNTGYWHMEGTYSTVPIPAAAWLLGSGLLGLVTFGRRKAAA